jgi:hypothetical protein
MSEYLAPGVYIEEVSFRSKSIPGVSTSTTGFVGPTRYGPIDLEPHVITSLGEFERIYGDGGQLDFGDASPIHNYLWHAVRAFFTEGGRRLYIARTFLPRSSGNDGIARANVPVAGGATALELRARFPGAAGNFLVRITVRIGPNILGGTTGGHRQQRLANDVVWIGDVTNLGYWRPLPVLNALLRPSRRCAPRWTTPAAPTGTGQFSCCSRWRRRRDRTADEYGR